MKRMVFCITLLVVFATVLFSAQQEIELPKGEVELQFDNVKLRDLTFIDSKNARIISEDKDEVKVTLEKQILRIASSKPVKIALELPKNKTYTFEKAKLSSRFTDTMVTLHDRTEDAIVVLKDKTLSVEKTDGTKVAEISPEGIFAYEDDQIVTIGKEGIIIEGDGKDKQFTGFWGKMLGTFVRLITGGVMSVVDSSPEKIIADVVNDEQGKMISSLFESSVDSRTKRSLSKTFEGKDGLVSNLEIDNSNGDVKISTWGKSYVLIEVEASTRKDEKDFDEVEITVEGEENCIIKTLNRPRSVSVNYDIIVPKDTAVKSVKTTNGRIVLQDVKGEKLVAITTNGGIETSNVYNIRSLHTSNARIHSEILNITDDIDIQTTNGRVQLYVNPNLQASFQMRTSNGTINTNITNLEEKERTKFTLLGDMGNGNHTIRVNTTNGNIIIDELR